VIVIHPTEMGSGIVRSPQPKPIQWFYLEIKTVPLHDETSVQVHGGLTVRQVKERLREKHQGAIPCSTKISLTFGGFELQDDTTLEREEVEEGAILNAAWEPPCLIMLCLTALGESREKAVKAWSGETIPELLSRLGMDDEPCRFILQAGPALRIAFRSWKLDKAGELLATDVVMEPDMPLPELSTGDMLMIKVTPTALVADPEGDSGLYCGPLNTEGAANDRGVLFYTGGRFSPSPDVFFGEFSNGKMKHGTLYSSTGMPRYTMESGMWTGIVVDRKLVERYCSALFLLL